MQELRFKELYIKQKEKQQEQNAVVAHHELR